MEMEMGTFLISRLRTAHGLLAARFPGKSGMSPFPHFHAFLPATTEIEESPPSPLSRAVLWCLIALTVAATLWASVGHVDIVATAPGKLVPAGQVKLLQSLSAGTVKAIHGEDD